MTVRPEVEAELAADRGGGTLHAVGVSFALLFAAEWGDLTQLIAAAQSARTGLPLSVFVGSWCALAAIAGTVLLGACSNEPKYEFAEGACYFVATPDNAPPRLQKIADNQPQLEQCAARLEEMRLRFLRMVRRFFVLLLQPVDTGAVDRVR